MSTTTAKRYEVESTEFHLDVILNTPWMPFCLKAEFISDAAPRVQPGIYRELVDHSSMIEKHTQKPGSHKFQSLKHFHATLEAKVLDRTQKRTQTDEHALGCNDYSPLEWPGPGYESESPQVGELVTWPPKFNSHSGSWSSSTWVPKRLGTPHACTTRSNRVEDQGGVPFNSSKVKGTKSEPHSSSRDFPELRFRDGRERPSELYEIRGHGGGHTPGTTCGYETHINRNRDLGIGLAAEPEQQGEHETFPAFQEVSSPSGKNVEEKKAKGMARLRPKAPPALDMTLIRFLHRQWFDGPPYVIVNEDDEHADPGDRSTATRVLGTTKKQRRQRLSGTVGSRRRK